MTTGFAIIAVLTIGSAIAAMSLRNLIHCSLALVATFAGLAAAYLSLQAQFVGFAQILVYIGAVSILVVFAILLTRSGDTPQESIFSRTWLAGIATVASVLCVLVWAIVRSGVVTRALPPNPDVTVHQIGDALMSKFVLPLEVVGLLLTASLIGAVIIAMQEKRK